MIVNDGNKPIDFICQHKMDGTVVPLRVRLRDEDGELKKYTVKRYRDLSDVVYSKFECGIIANGIMKNIIIFSTNGYEWKLI